MILQERVRIETRHKRLCRVRLSRRYLKLGGEVIFPSLSCFLGEAFTYAACACSLIVFTLIALSLVFIIFVFFLVTWLNS